MRTEVFARRVVSGCLEAAYRMPWFRENREERARILLDASGINIGVGESLLEIGTGKGDMWKMLSEGSSGKIVSLDLRDQVVSCNRRGSDSRVVADGLRCPFETGGEKKGFDVVLACLMLHHLPNGMEERMLREALRVTKTNGKVVVIEDNIDGKVFGGFINKEGYVRRADAILNMGVPGAGEAGQKRESDWMDLFKKIGVNAEMKTLQRVPLFGMLPWEVKVYELTK